MSRAIKYRCWDKKDKKYLLPEEQGFVILPTMPSFGVTIPFQSEHYPNENPDIDCIDWADADLLMDRYELEQYTGLLDRNGIEICEGDIVKHLFYRKDRIGQIVFDFVDDSEGYYIEKHYGWGIYSDEYNNTSLGDYADDNMRCELIEVIGNIHESPELLNPCNSTDLEPLGGEV